MLRKRGNVGTINPDMSGIVDGAVGDAADWTTPMNTIINEINGGLNTDNFAATGTDLATISAATAWTAWTPTFDGFSADPTITARYRQIGKVVIAELITSNAGTSDATNFTVTLPVAPKYAVSFAGGVSQDGGTYLSSPPRIQCAAGNSTATIYKDMATSTWTNSGNKYCDFVITYEAN